MNGDFNFRICEGGTLVCSVGDYAPTTRTTNLPPRECRLAAVIGAAARHYWMSRADICSTRRDDDLVRARKAAAWVMRHLHPVPSYEKIGAALGSEHTRAMHLVKVAEALRKISADFRAATDALLLQFRPLAVTD